MRASINKTPYVLPVITSPLKRVGDTWSLDFSLDENTWHWTDDVRFDGNIYLGGSTNYISNTAGILTNFHSFSGFLYYISSHSASPFLTINTTGMIIGAGAAGTDYQLNFNGETNDGIYQWMEDEDYFQSSDDWMWSGSERAYFRATDQSVYSSAASTLDLDAATTTKLRIGGSSKAELTTSELKPASAGGITLGASGTGWGDVYVNDGNKIYCRGTTEYLHSSAANIIELLAGDEVRMKVASNKALIFSDTDTAFYNTDAAVNVDLGTSVKRWGDAYLQGAKYLYLRGTTEYVRSSAASTLDLNAATTGNLRIGTTVKGVWNTNNFTYGSTASVSANYDIGCDNSGVLLLKERGSSATADANYGKIWSDSTNDRLIYQDGAGNEHIAAGYNVLYEDMYNLSTTLSPYPGRSLVNGASVYVSFRLPPDFNAISGIYARIMPDTTETIQWDVTGHWHADDEIYNAHTDNVLNDTKAVTVNVGTDLDLTAAVDSSTPSPGDTIGIRFISNTSNIRVVSIRLEYT